MANPYEASGLRVDDSDPQKKGGFSWVELLVVIGIIAVLLAFMLPSVRRSREPSRRFQCKHNLKQIMLALNAYREMHGHYPPAFSVDSQGNRLHSWRTLILPYCDQAALYKTIDLTKPWDHPANAEAYGSTVLGFRCASTLLEPGFTTYKAIVGSDAFFTDDGTPRDFKDITDDLTQTLAITEVSPALASHWMDPNNENGAEFLMSL